MVPFAHPSFDEQALRDELEAHTKIKNAYWFAHRTLGSKAKAFYGDIENVPGRLGRFDVVEFGMVLPHLRDPFRALHSSSLLSDEWVIITQQSMPDNEPIALCLPDPETRADHDCYIRRTHEGCTTYIARRVHGQKR